MAICNMRNVREKICDHATVCLFRGGGGVKPTHARDVFVTEVKMPVKNENQFF